MKYRLKKRVFDQYRDDVFNGLYSDISDRKISKRIIKKSLSEDNDIFALEHMRDYFSWS